MRGTFSNLFAILFLSLSLSSFAECTGTAKRTLMIPQFFWHDWDEINDPKQLGWQAGSVISRCVDVTITNVGANATDVVIQATANGPLFGSSSAVNSIGGRSPQLNYEVSNGTSSSPVVGSTYPILVSSTPSSLGNGQSYVASFCANYLAPSDTSGCIATSHPNCIGDWHMTGAFDIQVQICQDHGAVTGLLHSRQEINGITLDASGWFGQMEAQRNAQVVLEVNGGRPF